MSISDHVSWHREQFDRFDAGLPPYRLVIQYIAPRNIFRFLVIRDKADASSSALLASGHARTAAAAMIAAENAIRRIERVAAMISTKSRA